MAYIGIAKTKFYSSACLLQPNQPLEDVQIFLTERINRKKCSGAWPELPLLELNSQLVGDYHIIGDNRDVIKPHLIEDSLNQSMPFFEYLKKKDLYKFTSKGNTSLQHITHHLAHAYCALELSPYEESIILVLDGAGEMISDSQFESCSVYLQTHQDLKLIYTENVDFNQSGQGNKIGSIYEAISKFIFNNPLQSGKVMGLAPFGSMLDVSSEQDLLAQLDWKLSFSGKTKKEWESTDHSYFKNIAHTVQYFLEQYVEKILTTIKKQHPNVNNLILVGGCAMNCTNNNKIFQKKIFDNIYIPPFPGDDGISLGVASALKNKNEPSLWKTQPTINQSIYLGSKNSLPYSHLIKHYFNKDLYVLYESSNIIEDAVNLLIKGEILPWFQGRSETGQRALGNRSLLSRPDTKDLKKILNQSIKFREEFRPYGCSVDQEKAHEYFEVDRNFENPFMAFAVNIRSQYQELLKEVSHIDKTSRMQTVRPTQNKMFYNLINEFGKKSQLYCLLNTSLNIMDEPIVETVEDAERFFNNCPLSHMVIGDYLVSKK